MKRNDLQPLCKICGMQSVFFDSALVLRKYNVQYFRCVTCGFIQSEDPYWLDEAYSSAITKLDVGILQRNLMNRELTTAILNLLDLRVQTAVDFGGGHGIFVRLMRDSGFNFYWYDRHAHNDYARGFEYEEGQPCNFLTAFEVLEHLTDPIADFAKMLRLSNNLLVSTVLVPQPVPRISDWWYYAPSTGQHISLYTMESLRILAKQFGRSLLSNGSYHLFTTSPKSSLRFSLATHIRVARLLNTAFRRPSLIESDFQEMLK